MILALEHKCCLGPFPLSLALNPLATNRPKGGGGGASERRPCTLGMPVWFFVFFFFYHTKTTLSHWKFCFISLKAYAKSSPWGLW